VTWTAEPAWGPVGRLGSALRQLYGQDYAVGGPLPLLSAPSFIYVPLLTTRSLS
jgi:hypothetical protein